MHIDHRFVGFVTVLGALLASATAVPAAASEPAAAGAHAAAEPAGAHHEALKLNWTDFTDRHTVPVLALVINFALLVWLLVHYGKQPMRSFLVERQRKVQDEVDSAWEEKLRSEGKLQGLESRARHLDDELKTLHDDLLRIGTDERDRLLGDAELRAGRIRREAALVEREEERRAQSELRRRIVEQALGAAQATLQQRLTPADQSRLAEEFLKRLPAEEARPR